MRTRLLFLFIVCCFLAGCSDPTPPQYQDLKDADPTIHTDIGNHETQNDASSTTSDTNPPIEDHDTPNIPSDPDVSPDPDASPDSTSTSIAIITAGGGITTSTNYQLLLSIGVPSQADGYHSENYQLHTGGTPQRPNP